MKTMTRVSLRTNKENDKVARYNKAGNDVWLRHEAPPTSSPASASCDCLTRKGTNHKCAREVTCARLRKVEASFTFAPSDSSSFWVSFKPDKLVARATFFSRVFGRKRTFWLYLICSWLLLVSNLPSPWQRWPTDQTSHEW